MNKNALDGGCTARSNECYKGSEETLKNKGGLRIRKQKEDQGTVKTVFGFQ